MLTFGSLFSGIGGIDLGFERAGMSCSWQVEIDDYCRRVLEKHWPDVRRYRDVKEVGSHNLEPVDVITGGFPCQPHSVAGKRKGADDDRNLWPEYLRIVKELQPTWVVGENVPGIITTYLDTVISDLEGAGYEVATFNLPAAGFGANHIRYRLFIVANLDNPRRTRDRRTGTKRAQHDTIKRPLYDASGLDTVSRMSGLLVYDSPGTCPRLSMPKFGNMRRTGLESILASLAGYEAESGICGVAHGVSNRVDRLKGLGNAVVPAVAEFIGRAIVTALMRQ